ncbi:hypothetical protein OKW29_000245 [Paraburkholderia sp. CI3]
MDASIATGGAFLVVEEPTGGRFDNTPELHRTSRLPEGPLVDRSPGLGAGPADGLDPGVPEGTTGSCIQAILW